MHAQKILTVAVTAALLSACGGGSSNRSNNGNGDTLPTTYNFSSKIVNGADAVSYSGQATRQAIIADLKKLMGDVRLAGTGETATKQQILDKLNLLYTTGTSPVETGQFNLVNKNVYTDGAEATTPEFFTGEKLQATYGELSGDKNLASKIAGKDNLLTAKKFIGWSITKPAGDDAVKGEGINAIPGKLVEQWFDQLASLQSDGQDAYNDDKVDVITDDGIDLLQLIQKFLLGAVTYSQAAEDYLRTDKGLVAKNDGPHKDGKPYTALEHQWDEGYGYFGAARDYANYTDAENASTPQHDTNGDGKIDFYSEYSFGNSINAAKRDKGSEGKTDFSGEAFTAFIKGRQLIQKNFGENPVAGAGYHIELNNLAGEALAAWEKAIASTVVHYINDTLADMDKFGESTYSLADHAKHWSEMKGFALGLQFNPRALMSLEKQETMHNLMGEKPILASAQATAIAQYKADLQQARLLLQEAYGFDAAVVAAW